MTKLNAKSALWFLFALAILSSYSSTASAAERRALIICGLTGSEEYREQFSDSIRQIRTALIDRMGFEEKQVRVQFGLGEDEEPIEDLPRDGNATREEIAAEAKQLVAAAGDEDTTWVFVVGHAYFDGKSVFLNIPDADITHKQFASLFAKLKGQSAFFISTPVSGFYIRHLAKKNRVVMTSTEADIETNGSIYDMALAKTFSEISTDASFDLDKNGSVTVLDLYIKAAQNLVDLYYENDPPLIPTEHPQIDDDGDGRGSELQIDYLTMEQGGRSDSKRKRRIRKFRDGKLAAMVPLGLESK